MLHQKIDEGSLCEGSIPDMLRDIAILLQGIKETLAAVSYTHLDVYKRQAVFYSRAAMVAITSAILYNIGSYVLLRKKDLK